MLIEITATVLALIWACVNALPTPELHVQTQIAKGRQFVFLAPQIPKVQVQPTFRIQPEFYQPFSLAPKFEAIPAATTKKQQEQYVFLYPSYQVYTFRQNDEGSSGDNWYTSIQNWFQNIGQGSEGTPSDESADPVAETATATRSGINFKDAMKESAKMSASPALASATAPAPAPAPAPAEAEKMKVLLADGSEKYFYITPASTTLLTPNKRNFFFSEQQPFFGSFSGPSVNPVFQLQPLPTVVVGRSSVASVQAESQPSTKDISENVQTISQVPAVMSAIVPEIAPLPQLKSRFTGVIPDDEPLLENRLVPVVPPAETRAGVQVDADGKIEQSIAALNAPLPLINELIVSAVPKTVSEIVSARSPSDLIVAKDALLSTSNIENQNGKNVAPLETRLENSKN